MKKILLLLILFFNIVPCMKNGHIKLISFIEVKADGFGDGEINGEMIGADGLTNSEWMALSDPSGNGVERYLDNLKPDDKITPEFVKELGNPELQASMEMHTYTTPESKNWVEGRYVWINEPTAMITAYKSGFVWMPGHYETSGGETVTYYTSKPFTLPSNWPTTPDYNNPDDPVWGWFAQNGYITPNSGNNNTSSYSTQVQNLISQLSLNQTQINWLVNNPTEVNEIQNFLNIIQTDESIDEVSYNQNMISNTKIAMNIFIDGKQESQIDNTIFNKDIASALPLPSIIPTALFIASYNRAIAVNSAILKLQHPDWSQFHLYLMATANTWQLGLDVLGCFPVVGTVANLTSGTIYVVNGDNVNATLSAVAAIPVAGWVAKGASVAVKDGNLMVKISNGSIKFTRDQSLFRSFLGLIKGDGFIAHHVIPFGIQEHDLVQKAAEAGFHINEASNAIKITTPGSHPAYDNRVRVALNAIISDLGGDISKITPQVAKAALADLINEIATAIKNNPNVKINDLIF